MAGVVRETTCAELFAAIPERVGKAVVLVALTTLGAFPVLTGKLLALVESVAVGDVESILAGFVRGTTCAELFAAIPERVGKAAVLVAFTNIGAFLSLMGNLAAYVKSAVMRAVGARGSWEKVFGGT